MVIGHGGHDCGLDSSLAPLQLVFLWIHGGRLPLWIMKIALSEFTVSQLQRPRNTAKGVHHSPEGVMPLAPFEKTDLMRQAGSMRIEPLQGPPGPN